MFKYSLKYFLASALLLTAGFTGLFESVRDFVHGFANPIQFGLYKTSLSLREPFVFLWRLKSLRGENLKLLEENLNLKERVVILSEVEAENDFLKKELEIPPSGVREKRVLAQIIGLPYDNENSEILVNRGLRDGVKTGNPAVVGNLLVGVVLDVFERRSVIVLSTSPKFSAAVLDQDSSDRTKGLVSGIYGSSLLMDRILPSEKISTGDTIVTSGQDGVFAPGLIVGTVVEVLSSDKEPLKRAKLKALADLNGLERVFVLVGEEKL